MFKTDQAFGRGERVQRVADFGEAAFDTCDGYAVGVGTAFIVETPPQRPDFGFQRLDRLPRHGFLEHHADLGEIVAQGLDRGVDTAGAHGVDTGVELPKLLFEVREALGRSAGQIHRRPGETGFEHALRGFDFGQRLIDRGRLTGPGRRGGMPVDPRHGAVDRARPARALGIGGSSILEQAVDLAIEP